MGNEKRVYLYRSKFKQKQLLKNKMQIKLAICLSVADAILNLKIYFNVIIFKKL